MVCGFVNNLICKSKMCSKTPTHYAYIVSMATRCVAILYTLVKLVSCSGVFPFMFKSSPDLPDRIIIINMYNKQQSEDYTKDV